MNCVRNTFLRSENPSEPGGCEMRRTYLVIGFGLFCLFGCVLLGNCGPIQTAGHPNQQVGSFFKLALTYPPIVVEGFPIIARLEVSNIGSFPKTVCVGNWLNGAPPGTQQVVLFGAKSKHVVPTRRRIEGDVDGISTMPCSSVWLTPGEHITLWFSVDPSPRDTNQETHRDHKGKGEFLPTGIWRLGLTHGRLGEVLGEEEITIRVARAEELPFLALIGEVESDGSWLTKAMNVVGDSTVASSLGTRNTGALGVLELLKVLSVARDSRESGRQRAIEAAWGGTFLSDLYWEIAYECSGENDRVRMEQDHGFSAAFKKTVSGGFGVVQSLKASE